jgi:hypothetical protein
MHFNLHTRPMALNLFFRVSPDVISPQFATPKVVGV